jgi:hypothetical protein
MHLTGWSGMICAIMMSTSTPPTHGLVACSALSRSALVALCALAACGAPTIPAAGPTPPSATAPTGVERLLERSGIESIVSDRARAFTRQVALFAGDLTDPELERLVPAVQQAFAAEALRADVVAFIESEVPDEATVAEVLRFEEAGANARVRQIVDAHEPTLSLPEYARSLLTSPPAQQRVDIVVEWAETQGAGDFFVLIDEALRQAAYEVWGVLRRDTPRFMPASGPELQARLADSFNASVVTFLHAYETVPDSLLSAATAEYATEAGQWYVDAYTLGVAQAVRAAGQRAAAELARAPSS